MYEMTLPISEQMFWGIVFVGGVVALSFVVFSVLPRPGADTANPLENSMRELGLTQLNPGLFFVLAALWALIFLMLTGGLFGLIWDVTWHAMPKYNPDGSSVRTYDVWHWRFRLVQMTALTTVLGAVVLLPVTLQKLKLNKEETEISKTKLRLEIDKLDRERFSKITEDLYSTKEVSVELDNRISTKIEDDLIRRKAAINQLEGLVREQPDYATRVSRVLSAYVRELTTAYPAKEVPDLSDVAGLKAWARGLKVQRSDMQSAVQVLGRLASTDEVQSNALEIDLRGANLQAMSLSRLNFKKANFREASLQGADLSRANLQEIDLAKADMQGVDLTETELRRASLREAGLQLSNLFNTDLRDADLRRAKMQNAELMDAELKGANLNDAELQEADLWYAQISGAKLRQVDMQNTDLRNAELKGADFSLANLKGADLGGADLQGANLNGAEIDEDTNFSSANLLAASVGETDLTEAPQILHHLDDLFGDQTTWLPDALQPPEHWLGDVDQETYNTKWRDFAASKGVDIPD